LNFESKFEFKFDFDLIFEVLILYFVFERYVQAFSLFPLCSDAYSNFTAGLPHAKEHAEEGLVVLGRQNI
jgi:hypothetical protein